MTLLRVSMMALLGLFSISASAGELATASADSNQSAAPAATAACSDPRYHEFDFWLGEWDVYGPKGNLVGRSSITRTLGDCVIHEHWRNATGAIEGKSFNIYDGLSKVWRQYWVDNAGGTLMLDGGLVDGRMVLTGTRPHLQTGAPQSQRITWTHHKDGSVQQVWDTSDDGGKTWQQSFDGHYRPHQP